LLMPIFTTRVGGDPKIMGIIEYGSSSHFIWHLGKSNPTIVGHLEAVFTLVHRWTDRKIMDRQITFTFIEPVHHHAGRLITSILCLFVFILTLSLQQFIHIFIGFFFLYKKGNKLYGQANMHNKCYSAPYFYSLISQMFILIILI